MNARWTLSSMIDDMPQPHSPPWTCQLMSVQCADSLLVLDFVALEPFPVMPARCPQHLPFTLPISVPGHVEAVTAAAALASWQTTSDVVTIVAGERNGRQWLCLSSNERRLVVQMRRLGEPSG